MDDRGGLEDRRQTLDLLRQIQSVKAIPAVSTPPAATPALSTGPQSMATRELLDVVVATAYEGAPWDELQRRLVVRAFPDLEEAIRSGTIYGRCARARTPIGRRAELQRHPYPEDIAAEAVEDCLARFRSRVLPEGQWDPEGELSLEDFFTACCLPDVANRWRWHLRRLPDVVVSLSVEDERVVPFPAATVPDPAETVLTHDFVAEALAPMASADQTAFVMLAAGWSSHEIARTLGIGRDALYARVSRARAAARARRTS